MRGVRLQGVVRADPFFVRPNAFGHDTPFLVEGPLTRTVEDAALALNALHGYDSRDPVQHR